MAKNHHLKLAGRSSLTICWLTRFDTNLARIDACGNAVCGDLELVSMCGCGVVVC